MICERLRGANFVTYDTFDIAFPDKGIIGIEGKNIDKPILDTNAVGKTLLLDAVYYPIFGCVLRKKRANMIGPHHRDMWIEGTYRRADGKRVSIARHKTPSAELVTIKADGKEYKGRPTKIQHVLDRLFGMPWLTFQNCILYGDSRENNFVYAADNKRKEILSEMAMILFLREAKKLVVVDLKTKEGELQHAIGLHEGTAQRIEAAEDRVRKAQERLKSLEQEKEERVSILKRQLKEESEEWKKGIDIPERIAKCAGQEMRYTNERKEAMAALDDLNESLHKKKYEEAKEERISTETLIEKRKADLDILREKRQCFTCLSDIDTDRISIIADELETSNFNVDQCQKEEDEHREVLKQARDIREKANNLTTMISETRITIADLEAKFKTQDTIKARMDTIREKIERVGDAKGQVQQVLEDATTEFRNARADRNKHLKQMNMRQTESDVLRFWSKKFGQRGIEADLVRDLVNEIGHHASRYIDRLTEGAIGIEIEQDDEIDINVIENGQMKDFDLYSGGQRNRIEKAIRLAMMKASQSDIRFKLFDEIGKDLSTKGYESVIVLMKDIFAEQQIFLVTNDRESKKLFDYRLLITRENGRSRIDYG